MLLLQHERSHPTGVGLCRVFTCPTLVGWMARFRPWLPVSPLPLPLIIPKRSAWGTPRQRPSCCPAFSPGCHRGPLQGTPVTAARTTRALGNPPVLGGALSRDRADLPDLVATGLRKPDGGCVGRPCCDAVGPATGRGDQELPRDAATGGDAPDLVA